MKGPTLDFARADDVLDLQQWCTDHSHGELYNAIQTLHEIDAQRLAQITALEQQCKQCYLESKGEGP